MVDSNLSVKEKIALYKSLNQVNIVRIIRQITRYLTHEITRRLEKSGHSNLSARHLSVFENLDFEGTNIVNLANRAGLTKQAMSKLVKEVYTEGYVNVEPDKRDSRVVMVSFSEKGMDFLKDMYNEIQLNSEEIHLSGVMNEDELSTMISSLKKYLEHLKNSAY